MKNKKSRVLCVFIFLTLILGCVGCKKENVEEKKTLTLCVDSSFSDDATKLLDLWEALNEDVKGELEIIPQDPDVAEIKMSKIRTEMMSGKGPDVFLLSTNSTRYAEGHLSLFPNLEKTIYTDTFLPLDSFLEEAEHVNAETWNSKILEAGKTEKGQMILPISYSYQKLAFPKTEIDKASIPDSWDEVMKCENPLIQQEMSFFSGRFHVLFGKLADYKKGKLLFSKEDLQNQLEETSTHLKMIYERDLPSTDSQAVLSGWDTHFYTSLETVQEEVVLAGFPNVEGGITAGVELYTAVNKNTQMREEAFSLLDLMLRDEILYGQGIVVGEKVMADNLLINQNIDQMISENYVQIKYPQISDETKTALAELEQKINTVTLYSNLEWELYHLLESYMRSNDEAERKELVSKAYDTMEMSIME